MNFREAIKHGIQSGFKYRNAAFYILLIQLVLSGLIGLISFYYIQGSIGSTTDLLKIIHGYNHDVIQDLLLYEQTGWKMIKAFTLFVLFLYLLIGPFITGGLFNTWKYETDNWATFWQGGGKYYGSIFKINGLLIIILLVLLGIIGGLGAMLTGWGLNYFLSEIPVLAILGALVLIFFFITSFLISIANVTKWNLITQTEETSIWKEVKNAFKKNRAKVWKYLLLAFLFLILSFVFASFINFLINCIPESGFLLILLALIAQILSLFIRVILRNSYLNSILGLG